MGFTEDVREFAEKTLGKAAVISTEEATKSAMIMPLFTLLGYDVTDPYEFCPEFTADYGVKKGEKVDYAILIFGEPQILIECKWCGEPLDKHGAQLFRYFGTSKAKFGILTNGIIYKFYTDLEETNKMDTSPFLEVDSSDIKDYQINELKKFCKENFDKDLIFNSASELKYSSLIKGVLRQELESTSDDFARYILSKVYEGVKTQRVVENFKPIVKKAFASFINDTVNQRISLALTSDDESNNENKLEIDASCEEEEKISKIVTTEEEIEAFYIVKGLLAGEVEVNRISYKDTASYFVILLDNKKTICRVCFSKRAKSVYIPNEAGEFIKYSLDTVSDIYQYRAQLIEVAERFI